ncbi:MAG: trypsin-like peptidase domain-containing protein [Chloroflexi bacterium]|nr:trypsin-like peptidase domain-containing protein [Chloroflexota bacterium]
MDLLRWKGLLALLVFTALLSGCASLRIGPRAAASPIAVATPAANAVAPATQAPSPTAPAATGLPAVADVVARVAPAVVSIAAQVQGVDIFLRPIRGVQSGTGVIFDARGYVLTNNHVIEGTQTITITLSDDRTFTAEVVGADPLSDLAVLRIGDKETFPHLEFADPSSVHVGDWVIAIGNALALPGGPTVTVGVVGALNRSVPVEDRVMHDLIQTDAAINEGNSGGPLVNLQGQVVGINTIVVIEAQGIGFAISTFNAIPVVKSLLENGRVVWPWMGVAVSDLTPGKALELGLSLREGVIIAGVTRNSPASRAGIRAGDIVLSLDDSKVPTVRELQRLLRERYKVGQGVQITLLRDGKEQKAALKLEEMPRS